MDVQLTAAHWVYLVGILVILATMALRKNIVVPAVIATFLTALVFSGSIVTGLSAIFNASLVAAKELFNIFLIIAMVTAMLGALRQLGADRMMVAPFRRVMRAGTSSFLVLAAVTYVISLFFWPTPAVPLVGAVLIPVAIRAGLSPLSVGMVIAICGQGMALSADYIIKVAPGISASAAGVDPDAVADKALVLSLIVGGTALVLTYLMQKKTWRTRLQSCSSSGKPRPIGESANHVPVVMIIRVGAEDRSRCRRGPPAAERRRPQRLRCSPRRRARSRMRLSSRRRNVAAPQKLSRCLYLLHTSRSSSI